MKLSGTQTVILLLIILAIVGVIVYLYNSGKNRLKDPGPTGPGPT
jgi:uncharacterized protein YpmB